MMGGVTNNKLEKTRSQPNLRHYSNIYLQEMRKSTKNLFMTPESPKYKAVVPTNGPWCSLPFLITITVG